MPMVFDLEANKKISMKTVPVATVLLQAQTIKLVYLDLFIYYYVDYFNSLVTICDSQDPLESQSTSQLLSGKYYKIVWL